MMESKVACPTCKTVLRSNKPIRAGIELRCPKCNAVFRVPADALVAAGAGVLAGSAPQPGVGQMVTAHPAPLPAAPAPMSAVPGGSHLEGSQPSVAISADATRRKRLALVAGGIGGTLVLSGILLAVLIAAGGKNSDLPELDINAPPVKKPPQPLIVLSKEDDEKVKAMVAKGVDYLRKTQHEKGSWGNGDGQWDNMAAFAGLTLLECGVPPDDPAVKKAARYARERLNYIDRTYPAALFLLFFDKLIDANAKAGIKDADSLKDKDRLETLALRLVAGQLPSGGWHYGLTLIPMRDAERFRNFLTDAERNSREAKRRGTREEVRHSSEAARKKMTEAGQQLPEGLRNTGVLHTPPADVAPGFFHNGGDNSNTQFAILALWAARRHKVPVEPALGLVARRFRNTQCPSGGFPYGGGGEGSPSMTCAGLLGLAVSFGLQEKRESGASPHQDEAVKKALKHLSTFVGNPAPNTPMGDMYFFWSVERVAMLYQLPRIVDKDWYHWGLGMLHQHQGPDGSWRGHGHGDHLIDTCFALLFLNRVNLAQDLTDKLKELEEGGPAILGLDPRKDP